MRRLTGSLMGFASAAARRRAASASMVAIDPSLNSTETMTGRERVEAAIALGLGDRPPVSAWGHTFKEEWTPSELARVTVERAQKFGWDFVKFQLRASCFAEAFGSVYRPSGHRLRAPVLEQVAVPDAESWQRLALVNPKALDDQVEAIGLVAQERRSGGARAGAHRRCARGLQQALGGRRRRGDLLCHLRIRQSRHDA